MDYGRRSGYCDRMGPTEINDHDYRDVDYRGYSDDGRYDEGEGLNKTDRQHSRGDFDDRRFRARGNRESADGHQRGSGFSNSRAHVEQEERDFRFEDEHDVHTRDYERYRRRSDEWRRDGGQAEDEKYSRSDYRAEDQKPSNIIMLRMLPPDATANEIRALLQVQGFQPRDVRLMRNKSSDAEHKLSMPQKDLPPRQLKDSAQGLLPLPTIYQSATPLLNISASSQPTEAANDTLILRNLGPHTTLEVILSSLAPFATLSASNVRLIKDKQTQLNRGFAFVQLTTIVEASQLLQILQALQPPLSIDGKNVTVEFAKGSKREACVTDSSRVSAASVASTAIAAAQWAVSQLSSGGDVNVYQQGAAVPAFIQQRPEGVAVEAVSYQGTGAVIGTVPVTSSTPGLMGVYDAGSMTTASLVPTVTESAAVSSAHIHAQSPAISTWPNQIVGKPQPATPGTSLERQQYPDPDVSTYQYDESSGYYYDPLTGLYYDANSQYYYNPHTQQYMYWDGDKHTYVPAPNNGADPAATAASSDLSGSTKDKKDKPKTKTAQQIAKDMERWAKSMNRQKESVRSASSALTQARLADERRESASADAGYAILEKKGALSDRMQILTEHMQHPDERESSPPLQSSASVYRGESMGEDQGEGERDERMTDWTKLACLLCRRQFPSKEALIRHQQLSELHKQNLEQRRARQALQDSMESQMKYRSDTPDAKKRKYSPM
ncbi:RNA-binding protein 10 [Bagarius yarrelli]|uniref:RNA-binding protein 10 n=1 Tax=Bagarius yarrelli TaxID=175774 RepID=A0A556UYQ3_BAGYA|nr:RNA-binding protein 10 [Bagarius yarrelli]